MLLYFAYFWPFSFSYFTTYLFISCFIISASRCMSLSQPSYLSIYFSVLLTFCLAVFLYMHYTHLPCTWKGNSRNGRNFRRILVILNFVFSNLKLVESVSSREQSRAEPISQATTTTATTPIQSEISSYLTKPGLEGGLVYVTCTKSQLRML